MKSRRGIWEILPDRTSPAVASGVVGGEELLARILESQARLLIRGEGPHETSPGESAYLIREEPHRLLGGLIGNLLDVGDYDWDLDLGTHNLLVVAQWVC